MLKELERSNAHGCFSAMDGGRKEMMEPDRVPAAGANRKQWKKILIVERDSALAALLREVVWQEISCDIFCVTTGEEALRISPLLSIP